MLGTGVDVPGKDLHEDPALVLGKMTACNIDGSLPKVAVVLALVLADDALVAPHEVAFQHPACPAVAVVELHRHVQLGCRQPTPLEHQPSSCLHR